MSTPAVGDVLTWQRDAFRSDGIPDLATRIDRVKRLQAMIADHADQLVDSLAADYGTRAREVSVMADVVGCMGDLDYQRKHLRAWLRPEPRGGRLLRAGVRQRVRRDPLGVVGVMGPWNFPVQLTIVPAGTALAAGNRVMMRPSEVTAHTAELLARIAPQYFSVEELAVIVDGQATGAEFAELAFDHLLFTGSPEVGARVAEAAGRNLVPVTLELGGKNPVVVDVDADLDMAASRIAASRLVNGGQVCMCPDYAFVPAARCDEFVAKVLASWRRSLPGVIANEHYTSVINDRHFDRVTGLIDDARARGSTVHQHVPAGERLPDRATRKIAPTVLTDVPPDASISTEEVFGPVLVVYPYRDLQQAIDHVNLNPHPLTIYWYGDDNARFERLQQATRSGSVNGNDFTANFLGSELPFGGVGRSGTGAYRGRAGFETFTHARAVAFSGLPVSLARLMAPPFGTRDRRLIGWQLSMARRRSRTHGERATGDRAPR